MTWYRSKSVQILGSKCLNTPMSYTTDTHFYNPTVKISSISWYNGISINSSPYISLSALQFSSLI